MQREEPLDERWCEARERCDRTDGCRAHPSGEATAAEAVEAAEAEVEVATETEQVGESAPSEMGKLDGTAGAEEKEQTAEETACADGGERHDDREPRELACVFRASASAACGAKG